MEARNRFNIWPLDDSNAKLLNEVHPKTYANPEPLELYDLIALGAGAGGLVSSKQSGRRGAKSAMISEDLAGGDCLNVGCVPSKALIKCAKVAAQMRRAHNYGITSSGPITVDFPAIMANMRTLRSKISPADGHDGTNAAGAQVFQGRGIFTGPNTLEVTNSQNKTSTLTFRKAVIATGGRPFVPKIPGLSDSPFTTNVNLFNLNTLPPRMVILGAGVVALEMAQTFARFGSHVTVLNRSEELFGGRDAEAGRVMRGVLESEGVTFLSSVTVSRVDTIRAAVDDDDSLPLLSIEINSKDGETKQTLECECLLVAAGRRPNVDNIGLENANVQYDSNRGVVINDLARTTNPDIYAVGDCVSGVPRLTHMSGEMAKVVVQNALFDDDWKISSLVVPACMYTEPEYASVGVLDVSDGNADVDVYQTGLEGNDRAILEGETIGFVKIYCEKGTGTIVGASIVAARAGEMINEISLAMKHGIGLDGIGRNIHCYPTTGEAIMGCGLQFINSKWKRLD